MTMMITMSEAANPITTNTTLTSKWIAASCGEGSSVEASFSIDMCGVSPQDRELVDLEVNMRTHPVPWLTVLGSLVMVACSSSAPPATPIAPIVPTALAYPNFTLSGVVTDSTSGMPLQGARVFVNLSHLSGVPSPDVRMTSSDATGRYQTSGLPIWGDMRWAQGSVNNDYAQQCGAPIITDGNTTTLNIQLTRYANLSSSTPPTLTAPNTRIVTGLVFKTVDGSRQPVAGAGVDFEPDIDFPAAWTRTDASGRYLLCGLPMSRIELGASSTSSDATYLTVNDGPDSVVDIELRN
jgi:hypothetical protein